MPHCYSEIFHQNSGFQRSINLSLDLGNLDFVLQYIPTKASADVLGRYLQAAIAPSGDRASLLIGPYGKGKSHTLFIALSILAMEGDAAEAAFEKLAESIDNQKTSELIRQIRAEKIRLLPVIINDRYLDVRQAFLASLKYTLSQQNLLHLMPDNYFDRCLLTIARWRQDYQSTYHAYKSFLKTRGMTVADFETQLKLFDASAVQLFQDCHRTILSGAEFDPLLESDVPTLYSNVSEALQTQSKYMGLFIVFDEFGKYLESAVSFHETLRFKVLQDLAEICGRSTVPCMLMTCITHKAISEYAYNLDTMQQTSFRTVEGRFTPIYFTSTFEGNFSLIAGALGRNRNVYQRFIAEHKAEHQATRVECEALGCFSGYNSSVEEIVDQCFPMHPLTTLSLMKLSERAAQNERTLFTFLSDQTGKLSRLIANNRGTYELADVTMVYDYFHTDIRDTGYDDELRELVVFTDALCPTLGDDESKLIRTIVLFSMVVDSCLLATKPILCAALGWTDQKIEETAQKLETLHRIYRRRSDGVFCLMRSATESVRQAIDHEILVRRNHKLDIAQQLKELREPGYTIPRRYNDQHEIVRYFQNVFISSEQFIRQQSSTFLIDNGFADGYVLYLLGNISTKDVQRKLQEWDAPNIMALVPQIPFSCSAAIEECAAIHHLLETTSDEIATEELSYYYNDILQVVNRAFNGMFDSQTLCVSFDYISPCKSVGSEVSRLCEDYLYSQTPIICHEMMNRTVISGQMRQTRERIIDAVFSGKEILSVFPAKTAEGAVVGAIFKRALSQPKMQQVLNIITEFVTSCEQERQPLQRLYQKLLSSPYGMRKGVLPILLAWVLREHISNITLYYQREELPICGENFSLLDDHLEDLFLLVDHGSTEQIEYLQILHDAFTPDDSSVSMRAIYTAMSNTVKALPRCARANRKRLRLEEDRPENTQLPQTVLDLRKVLISMENNARDGLLVQIPRALGFKAPSSTCASMAVDAVCDDLCKYVSRLSNALGVVIRKQFGASLQNSVRGAMTAWLQKQSSAKLARVYDEETTALLNVIRSQDNHTEAEWINMVAVALMGLPIEDWSDQQAPSFPGVLEKAITDVEQSTEVTIDNGNQIVIALGNKVLKQSVLNRELEGIETVVYNSLRSTIGEYGDALSTDEKLLVLANLMVRLNEKESL